MSSKILVGYDGSDRGRDALALARLLADRTNGELVVACVYPFEPLSSRIGSPDFGSLSHEDALATVCRDDPLLEGVPESHRRAVAAPSPAHGLHRLAEDEEANLIVVGSTHRGALGRVMPGSVGERLLHGAPCSVALAPRGFGASDAATLARIGVAVDGSPESKVALLAAYGLASDLSGGIRVITVIEWVATVAPTFGGPRRSYESLLEELREARSAAHEQALSEAPPGVSAEGLLLEGDVVSLLCEQSATIDLLVLGARGYGPLRHVLMGGVSSAVTRGAHCPVLVVPRGVSEPFGATAAVSAQRTPLSEARP